MTEWMVRRWARYGHVRLYAETPAGTAFGYLDLKTGRYHSDDLSNLPLLEKAVGDYLAAHPVAVPSGPATMTEVVRARPAAGPEWSDIRGARAGSAAREQALVARAAQGKFKGSSRAPST